MATIERAIDVDVPLRTAYNQWTQFEDFPRFMAGVREVKQVDETRLRWRAEIGGREKVWSAEIVEQVPDLRIAWRSLAGARNGGVVTFHQLDERRTRITLQLDYEPEDLVESLGSAVGIVSRRVDGDLERFKAFIEARGRETGAWRGEVPTREDGHEPAGPVLMPEPAARAQGSEMRMTRCPLHGIAYDLVREECPECAKGGGASPV